MGAVLALAVLAVALARRSSSAATAPTTSPAATRPLSPAQRMKAASVERALRPQTPQQKQAAAIVSQEYVQGLLTPAQQNAVDNWLAGKLNGFAGEILGAIPIVGPLLKALYNLDVSYAQQQAAAYQAAHPAQTGQPAAELQASTAQTGAQHQATQQKAVQSMGSAANDTITVEGGTITEAQRALLE